MLQRGRSHPLNARFSEPSPAFGASYGPCMSSFDSLSAIAPIAIWDGVGACAVVGEKLTLAVVELDPGPVVGEHSHANEQLGILLTGSMRLRAGNEERE